MLAYLLEAIGEEYEYIWMQCDHRGTGAGVESDGPETNLSAVAMRTPTHRLDFLFVIQFVYFYYWTIGASELPFASKDNLTRIVSKVLSSNIN